MHLAMDFSYLVPLVLFWIGCIFVQILCSILPHSWQ